MELSCACSSDGMGQGKRIVQVAIYLVFLLSIFGSALGDQNNTDEAAPIADADDSNSTDLNSTIYETEEEDDDDSTTTTPQPGALTSQYKYVVKTKLAFPYASLAAFDAQEAKIISAMKRSTGASAVEVLSRTLVTTRRSPSARALLATTVQAEFAVGVDTPEAAAKAVSGLSAENLNAALQNAGVEAATVIEAPKVTTQDGEAVDLSTTSIRQAPGDIVSNPAKGQAYVFADGTKTLATLVAEGTVTSFSVKWTKTSDGSAIKYPSDGATTKMKSSEGFHIAGRAVDIELVLPAGADYGVIATLPISFNNNGDLPTARRAAATGYEFRINAE